MSSGSDRLGRQLAVRYALAEARSPRAGGAGVLAKLAEVLFIEVLRLYMQEQSAACTGWLAGVRDPVVGVALQALPFTGRLSPGFQLPNITGFLLLDALISGKLPLFWDAFKHMILPSAALGIALSPALMRVLRRQNRPGLREVHAIRGISFVANRGDAVGIIGRNGSGKSTLLRAIAGLLPPESGAVYTTGEASLLSRVASR